MTNARSEGPVLVLGGTGKTRRRVAARLTAAGREVRIGSRSQAVPFDWERPDTWQAALDGRNTPIADGVQRALGRAPRSFSDFVRHAAATGVRRGNNG